MSETTGCQIVTRALRNIRVAQAGQPTKASDMSKGIDALNTIVKSWIADGLHLWKDKEGVVFLEKGRKSYDLGSPSGLACSDDGCKYDAVQINTVHATSGDWVLTKTTSAAIVGESTINIESLFSYAGVKYNTACAMNIGFINSVGIMDWYSVATVLDLEIGIACEFTADIPEGETVYIYREADQMDKPLKIYQDNVRLLQVSANYELPLYMLSMTDYNLLPDKHTEGVPVQMFYTPQKTSSQVIVWPVSYDYKNVLLFRFQSPLSAFSSETETPDFPEEWFRALEWALSSELAIQYGLPLDRQAALDARAASLKSQAEDWDQDNSSLYIYPRQWGQS